MEKSSAVQQSDQSADWTDYNKQAKPTVVIDNSNLKTEYVYNFDSDKFPKGYTQVTLFSYDIVKLDTRPATIVEGSEPKKAILALFYFEDDKQALFMYYYNNTYYKVKSAITVRNPLTGNNDLIINNMINTTKLTYNGIPQGQLILEGRNGAVLISDKQGNFEFFGVERPNKTGQTTVAEQNEVGKEDEGEPVNGYLYRKPVKKLLTLESGTRYIVKEDVFLDNTRVYNNVDEIVLDGGNLFRHHGITYTPRKLTCVNGSFIDITSPYTTACDGKIMGPSYSHLVNAGENTSVKNFGEQSNYCVEFNLMDFVNREDYVVCGSAMSINLNSVLDKIFNSVYNISANYQVMVVKMPETHFGGSNFFVERPVIIPYGVTLDLSGAKVHVKDGFKKEFPGMRNEDVKSIYRRDDFVFAFASLPGVKNFVKSKVVNAEIIMSNTFEKDEDKKYPKVVFNLTNFFGEMENVTVNLWRTTDTVAFWQPYGNGQETYSDRKIFRRCQVSNCGWRTKTPTALFCLGDGCVIEQCILGYVAIIGGNSYTIRGCLNDSYFIYDSTVDFTGSYWEVGQFQILDSKVRFAECKLTCDNNNFNLRMAQNLRRYLGPWMAVDTDGCRKRLKGFISNMQLGDDYFDQTKGDKNRTQYKGHASIQHSTVVFDPTIRFETVYWGYRQPISGPVLKTGDETRLIGVENLEAPNRTFIKNDVNANVFNGNVNLANYATIPLVNGTFFNLGRNVEVPTGIKVYAYSGNENLQDKASKCGLDWNGEVFNDISVRIVLDPERKLYSEAYSDQTTIGAEKGKEVYISVRIPTGVAKKHPNLMVELTFRRKSTGKYYRMRQHFSRVVMGDMVSFGTTDLIPSAGNEVIIAMFNIAKVYSSDSEGSLLAELCEQELVERVTDDGIFDGVYSNITDALSDGCGNMCMPLASKDIYSDITLASNLIRISERNVRVYLLDSALPLHGKWVDGDEVVNKDNVMFTLYKKRWYNTSVFSSPITPEISD